MKATCKHCGLPEDEITGPCAQAPTHEIIAIAAEEPSAAEAPATPPPPAPADPLERALWDLIYSVQETPAVEAVPTCTRAAALAAVYQARALREIAEHIQNLLLRPVAEPPADYSPLSTAPDAGSHRCLIFQDPGPPWYGAQCKRFAPHAGPCDFGTMEEAKIYFCGEARHKFAAPPGHFICVVCKRIKADPLHDPPEPGR